MKTTRYLIIGGGMTGDAATQGIRDRDPEGTVTLVGAEQHPPYKRPPLTKGLWSGGDEAKLWLGTEGDLRPRRARAPRGSAGASSRSTRRRARRPTTPARPTPTSACCSPRAAGRASCPAPRA